MRMRRVRRAAVIVASIATAVGSTALASAATAQAGQAGGGHPGRIRHVLLISVDGLHQQDLAWYVHTDPNSVLAALATAPRSGPRWRRPRSRRPTWRCLA